ncbi:unnamed protein product [Miscanthus lutarioriparius]|uniref:Uncharacterized protein n=1 Tax=Miscanthus lutarioriparius TaxID=422564 RepID=A0A811NL27_9POAL|nr:unnamed protein product [Miscanthus lutarioriparius]
MAFQNFQVAKDPSGKDINALEQHIKNLLSPSTPFFFNTLYDPYRVGARFCSWVPLDLREGVPTAVSHGLWLNIRDYDAPTHFVKPLREKHQGTLFPMCGMNLAFDRELIGPAMYFGLMGDGHLLVATMICGQDGAQRYIPLSPSYLHSVMPISATKTIPWPTIGFHYLCLDKTTPMSYLAATHTVITDHTGTGVKTGLPYIRTNKASNLFVNSKKEYNGIFRQEESIPFFRSVSLPKEATTVQKCYLELAKR